MKFDSVEDFAAHYYELAKSNGGRNDWRVGLAKTGFTIPNEDECIFFEDYYVRVVASLTSDSLLIERKQNANPVYCRKNGDTFRTHGEWKLCQHPHLVTGNV